MPKTYKSLHSPPFRKNILFVATFLIGAFNIGAQDLYSDLDSWISALRSKDQSVALKAAYNLTDFGQDTTSASLVLIQNLQDTNYLLIEQSTRLLGELKLLPEQAIPALIPLLSHPNDKIKQYTSLALSRYGAQAIPYLRGVIEKSPPPIFKVSGEKNPRYSEYSIAAKHAAFALAFMGESSMKEIKIEPLKVPYLYMHILFKELGIKFNTRNSEEKDLSSLNSPNVLSRLKAADLLLRKDPANQFALDTLLKALNHTDSNRIREATLILLRHKDQGAFEIQKALIQAPDLNKIVIMESLSSRVYHVDSTLIRLCITLCEDTNEDVSLTAAKTLQRYLEYRNSRNVPIQYLKEILKTLIDQVHRPDQDLKKSIAQSLGILISKARPISEKDFLYIFKHLSVLEEGPYWPELFTFSVRAAKYTATANELINRGLGDTSLLHIAYNTIEGLDQLDTIPEEWTANILLLLKEDKLSRFSIEDLVSLLEKIPGKDQEILEALQRSVADPKFLSQINRYYKQGIYRNLLFAISSRQGASPLLIEIFPKLRKQYQNEALPALWKAYIISRSPDLFDMMEEYFRGNPFVDPNESIKAELDEFSVLLWDKYNIEPNDSLFLNHTRLIININNKAKESSNRLKSEIHSALIKKLNRKNRDINIVYELILKNLQGVTNKESFYSDALIRSIEETSHYSNVDLRAALLLEFLGTQRVIVLLEDILLDSISTYTEAQILEAFINKGGSSPEIIKMLYQKIKQGDLVQNIYYFEYLNSLTGLDESLLQAIEVHLENYSSKDDFNSWQKERMLQKIFEISKTSDEGKQRILLPQLRSTNGGIRKLAISNIGPLYIESPNETYLDLIFQAALDSNKALRIEALLQIEKIARAKIEQALLPLIDQWINNKNTYTRKSLRSSIRFFQKLAIPALRAKQGMHSVRIEEEILLLLLEIDCQQLDLGLQLSQSLNQSPSLKLEDAAMILCEKCPAQFSYFKRYFYARLADQSFERPSRVFLLLKRMNKYEKEMIALFFPYLKNNNPIIRLQAISAIGECALSASNDSILSKHIIEQDSTVINVLLEAMNNNSSAVRAEALYYLGLLNQTPPEARLAIEKALFDPYLEVRKLAEQIIQSLPFPSSPMRSVLQKRFTDEYLMAYFLGKSTSVYKKLPLKPIRPCATCKPNRPPLTSQPGSSNDQVGFSKLPWPPPPATTRGVIPMNIIGDAADSLGSVFAKFQQAFLEAGYRRVKLYGLNDGFAMISRLERIQENGTPHQVEDERFSTKEIAPLNLKGYLQSLLFGTEGHFRVMLFIVSPLPNFKDNGRPFLSVDGAKELYKEGGDVLPPSIAAVKFKDKYVHCLIYQFRKKNGGEINILTDSNLIIDDHLERTGIKQALLSND